MIRLEQGLVFPIEEPEVFLHFIGIKVMGRWLIAG